MDKTWQSWVGVIPKWFRIGMNWKEMPVQGEWWGHKVHEYGVKLLLLAWQRERSCGVIISRLCISFE